MFIIRGVNVFPTQIEEALLRVKGTAPHYVIEIDRPGAMDEMTVNVEILPEYFSDKMSDMKEISQKIGDAIKSVTGVRAKLNLVQYATLERFLGKAKRVIDKRKLN
jgi:phenylacetate-CoA ligase